MLSGGLLTSHFMGDYPFPPHPPVKQKSQNTILYSYLCVCKYLLQEDSRVLCENLVQPSNPVLLNVLCTLQQDAKGQLINHEDLEDLSMHVRFYSFVEDAGETSLTELKIYRVLPQTHPGNLVSFCLLSGLTFNIDLDPNLWHRQLLLATKNAQITRFRVDYSLAMRDQKEETNKITYFSALLSKSNLQPNAVNLSEHAGLGKMRQNNISYRLQRLIGRNSYKNCVSEAAETTWSNRDWISLS